MTFSRQWATGLSDGQPAGGAQLTQLDLNVSRAPDAFAGGVYHPSSPLIISPFGFDGPVQGIFSLAQSAAVLGVCNIGLPQQNSTNLPVSDAVSPSDGIIFTTPGGAHSNVVSYSFDDGESWSSTSIGSPSLIWSCIGASPTVIIISGESANHYAYSTNGGTAWTIVDITSSGVDSVESIHYAANLGLFILCGHDSAGPAIITIPNATPGTFTKRTIPASMVGGTPHSLSISQAPPWATSFPGRIVATWSRASIVGGAGSGIAYSDDGVSWTAATVTTVGDYVCRRGNGFWLALDGQSASSLAFTSTTGAAFSTVATKPVSSLSIAKRELSSLNGVFVTKEVSDGTFLAISVDGTNWGVLAHRMSAPRSLSCLYSGSNRMYLFMLDSGDTYTYLYRGLKTGLASLGL